MFPKNLVPRTPCYERLVVRRAKDTEKKKKTMQMIRANCIAEENKHNDSLAWYLCLLFLITQVPVDCLALPRETPCLSLGSEASLSKGFF